MAYVRKTVDEYWVMVSYGYGHGFEVVCVEETYKAARETLKDYRENEPGYPKKIVKKRVKKELN